VLTIIMPAPPFLHACSTLRSQMPILQQATYSWMSVPPLCRWMVGVHNYHAARGDAVHVVYTTHRGMAYRYRKESTSTPSASAIAASRRPDQESMVPRSGLPEAEAGCARGSRKQATRARDGPASD